MTADPALYARAVDVFAEVADLSEADRLRALDEACNGDASLRAMVEGMLAHDRELAAPSLVDSVSARLADGFEELTSEAAATDRSIEVLRADGYRFIRRLGAGGMGAVWLAEQVSPRREVACKVIHAWSDGVKDQRRFEREIDALARLRDPGITQVYAAGVAETDAGPRPFFAMELVDGPDLVEHANELGLSVQERVELFVGVCDAVHHVHEQGVVHRDLKPANILVDRRGEPHPKVLDFGVARILDDSGTGATIQGDSRLFGTLPYMAPEQASGRSDAIGPATDVYALGACLYHLVAGRLPLELSGLGLTEALAKIRDVDPLPLDSPIGAVATDLDVIVRKAISKEAAARYRSAAALAEDLRSFLADRPIVARPPGALERLGRFGRKNRATVVGVAATLLVAVAGAIVATLYAVRAHDAELLAVRGREEAERLRYAAEVGAGLAIVDADPRQARRHLEAADEAYRGWEWRHLASRLDRVVSTRPWTGSPPRRGEVDLHRGVDGISRVAVARGSALVLLEAADGSEPRTIELAGEVTAPMFAGRGGRVGCIVRGAETRDVVVVDFASGAVVWRHPVPGADAKNESLALDGGGTRALFRGGSELVELGDGSPPRPSSVTGTLLGFALSDDGRASFVSHRSGRSNLMTRTGDGPTTRDAPQFRYVMSSAVGLFVVDHFRHVFHLDPGSLAELDRLDGHRLSPHTLSVSATGTVLASASDDGTVRIWDIASGACRATLGVRAHDVVLSADGSRCLAATDEGLVTLDSTGESENLVLEHGDYIQCAEFCHGGRVVVTGGGGRAVKFWDAVTGELLAMHQVVENAAPRSLGVSADGEEIYIQLNWVPKVLDVASLAARVSEEGWFGRLRPGSRMKSVDDGVQTRGTGGGMVAYRRSVRRQESKAVIFETAGDIVALDIDPGSVGRLAMAEGESVRLRSADGTALSGELTHDDVVYSVAFSPDGRRLATSSNDATWRICSVDPLRELVRFQAHDIYVHSASWSVDGTRVVTSGGDGKAILWDSRPLRERLAEHERDLELRDEMRPRVERLVEASEDLGAAAAALREDGSLDEERRAAALFCLLRIAGKR